MIRLIRFQCIPEAEVELGWADVESLMLYSERHYDAECRRQSQPGGILFALRNWCMRPGAPVKVLVTAEKVDLLAKIAECDPTMKVQFAAVFRALVDKFTAVNAREVGQ